MQKPSKMNTVVPNNDHLHYWSSDEPASPQGQRFLIWILPSGMPQMSASLPGPTWPLLPEPICAVITRPYEVVVKLRVEATEVEERSDAKRRRGLSLGLKSAKPSTD